MEYIQIYTFTIFFVFSISELRKSSNLCSLMKHKPKDLLKLFLLFLSFFFFCWQMNNFFRNDFNFFSVKWEWSYKIYIYWIHLYVCVCVCALEWNKFMWAKKNLIFGCRRITQDDFARTHAVHINVYKWRLCMYECARACVCICV